MGFYLRIDNEDMQQAIESHNYKPGFQSIEHAESQIEPGESYQIYREVEITSDELPVEKLNNRAFKLVKSGMK